MPQYWQYLEFNANKLQIKYLNNANYEAIYCRLTHVYCHYLCIMNLSLNIKKLREAKRLTQNDIAERIGVDGSNYAKQEKRGNKLSIEQLEKIALALGVTVQELMFGEAVGDTGLIEKLKTEIAELEAENKALKKDLKRKEKLIDMISPFAETVMKGLEVVHKAMTKTNEDEVESSQVDNEAQQKAKELVDSIFDKKS